MPREKIYKYPNPEKIQINEADLKLELREYYDVVVGKGSFLDLFLIIPAWIPIFTSNFKDVFGASGSLILGAYGCVVVLGTLVWFFRIRSVFYRLYKKKIRKDEDWLRNNEIDPCKKVMSIKDKCK